MLVPSESYSRVCKKRIIAIQDDIFEFILKLYEEVRKSENFQTSSSDKGFLNSLIHNTLDMLEGIMNSLILNKTLGMLL